MTKVRELLTITGAAKRAIVSRRTIYYWLAAGKLDTIRTAGGATRIYADSLWMTQAAYDAARKPV